jgi:hypothetical protein
MVCKSYSTMVQRCCRASYMRGPVDPITRMPLCSRKSRAEHYHHTRCSEYVLRRRHTKPPSCMLLWRPCITSPLLHMKILADHHPVLLPPVRFFRSVFLLSALFLSSVKYQGPWLSTQILISSFIGVAALLIFSYCRTRWPLLFAPRTKLKGT